MVGAKLCLPIVVGVVFNVITNYFSVKSEMNVTVSDRKMKV